MAAKQHGSRCKARNKAGKSCRAAATEGGLCFFHTNPNKASELGRIGGSRSKRWAAAENADPLPTPDDAIAVRDTVARLIIAVHSGALHPRIASVLTPLLSLQLRTIETADLAQQLAELKKRLGEHKAEGAPDVSQNAPLREGGDPPPAKAPLGADPETAAASDDTLDAPSPDGGAPPQAEEPLRAKARGSLWWREGRTAGSRLTPPHDGKPSSHTASKMAKTPIKDRLG